MASVDSKTEKPNSSSHLRNSNARDKLNVKICEVAHLKPRFSAIAAIGIQYSIRATPLAVGAYLTFILGLGGRPYFFFGFIVAAVGQILLCVSLAKIAAVYPHASGQAFWIAALAPSRFSRALSYCNGAATTLGWIFANARHMFSLPKSGLLRCRFDSLHTKPNHTMPFYSA
ncbi:amino acid transporter [Fusarium pseudocircinatum]|uniref:Amino acid transporter n=1 Tax=Fusarium pseudocircinatum TaxID=56676 RepID=A0A8H5PVA2_9HYPO|nr:amino acid transporter [Fusarium pseudocircinatum]